MKMKILGWHVCVLAFINCLPASAARQRDPITLADIKELGVIRDIADFANTDKLFDQQKQRLADLLAEAEKIRGILDAIFNEETNLDAKALTTATSEFNEVRTILEGIYREVETSPNRKSDFCVHFADNEKVLKRSIYKIASALHNVLTFVQGAPLDDVRAFFDRKESVIANMYGEVKETVDAMFAGYPEDPLFKNLSTLVTFAIRQKERFGFYVASTLHPEHDIAQFLLDRKFKLLPVKLEQSEFVWGSSIMPERFSIHKSVAFSLDDALLRDPTVHSALWNRWLKRGLRIDEIRNERVPFSQEVTQLHEELIRLIDVELNSSQNGMTALRQLFLSSGEETHITAKGAMQKTFVQFTGEIKVLINKMLNAWEQGSETVVHYGAPEENPLEAGQVCTAHLMWFLLNVILLEPDYNKKNDKLHTLYRLVRQLIQDNKWLGIVHEELKQKALMQVDGALQEFSAVAEGSEAQLVMPSRDALKELVQSVAAFPNLRACRILNDMIMQAVFFRQGVCAFQYLMASRIDERVCEALAILPPEALPVLFGNDRVAADATWGHFGVQPAKLQAAARSMTVSAYERGLRAITHDPDSQNPSPDPASIRPAQTVAEAESYGNICRVLSACIPEPSALPPGPFQFQRNLVCVAFEKGDDEVKTLLQTLFGTKDRPEGKIELIGMLFDAIAKPSRDPKPAANQGNNLLTFMQAYDFLKFLVWCKKNKLKSVYTNHIGLTHPGAAALFEGCNIKGKAQNLYNMIDSCGFLHPQGLFGLGKRFGDYEVAKEKIGFRGDVNPDENRKLKTGFDSLWFGIKRLCKESHVVHYGQATLG
ncbi:MAG: hypothetical protein LBF72_02405 [Holosporales bacterium]|jgi:hypothetical protein|nr:hypothetical protein [Holosporales bacterium]